eukprot:5028377-Amphidinium_carterae.1
MHGWQKLSCLELLWLNSVCTSPHTEEYRQACSLFEWGLLVLAASRLGIYLKELPATLINHNHSFLTNMPFIVFDVATLSRRSHSFGRASGCGVVVEEVMRERVEAVVNRLKVREVLEDCFAGLLAGGIAESS